MEKNYKNITIEDIKKGIEEVFGKMSPKEIDDMFVKYLGNGIYRLPGGALTGEGGAKMVDEAMKKQVDKNKENDNT